MITRLIWNWGWCRISSFVFNVSVEGVCSPAHYCSGQILINFCIFYYLFCFCTLDLQSCPVLLLWVVSDFCFWTTYPALHFSWKEWMEVRWLQLWVVLWMPKHWRLWKICWTGLDARPSAQRKCFLWLDQGRFSLTLDPHHLCVTGKSHCQNLCKCVTTHQSFCLLFHFSVWFQTPSKWITFVRIKVCKHSNNYCQPVIWVTRICWRSCIYMNPKGTKPLVLKQLNSFVLCCMYLFDFILPFVLDSCMIFMHCFVYLF